MMNTNASTLSLRMQRRLLNRRGEPASSMLDSVYAQHPPGTPTKPVTGPVPWLLDNPGREAPTADWLVYRASCEQLVARHPNNPRAQACLDAAQEVLTWRAALPEHLHFWREDKHEPGTR
ncbi:hypothetical protein [Azospirillum sp. TSA6c]|uniref:hypothetical protein n=1 Tax=Azospirillum sp. TSA6c TaxID=709813 RepID=UPI0011B83C29|nr:hypothetical protein [Azospirillum sp. TSA6c]